MLVEKSEKELQAALAAYGRCAKLLAPGSLYHVELAPTWLSLSTVSCCCSSWPSQLAS